MRVVLALAVKEPVNRTLRDRGDLAQMLPGFSSAADQIKQILRVGVVQAMQGSPSPAIPQGGMGMGMMT